MNPLAIGCFVFAVIALIATGFPEARGESVVAAVIFAAVGGLVLLIDKARKS